MVGRSDNISSGPARLTVDALVKRYPGSETNAVDGLSFSVAAGEIFGLLGPNGAGKTTTVSVATTRARPTSGSVAIADLDVAASPSAARRRIGVVTQVNTLDRSLSIRENLYYHCRYFGMARAQSHRRSDELLEQMGLRERADEMVPRLSGGLAQRVQLARALAHRPAVLFLDEPTAGLDPQSRLALWDAIRDLRDHEGTSVLLTTHYMEEAERLCERVAIVDHGRMLVCDTPAALRRDAAGQVTIRLRLGGEPAPELVERARVLPGVAQLAQDGDTIEVVTAERDALLPRLAALAGPQLRDLSVTEPSLESVFIGLTGRTLRG